MCMSMMQHTEYMKAENELSGILEEIDLCPRGSIRIRDIRGRSYYYLQYRDGKHIKSQYISADELPQIRADIAHRRDLEKQAKELRSRLERYAKMLGIHRTYRPVKNIDYDDYTLFMSTVAHDYRLLDPDSFMEKYDVSKYRGINKRYLAGFLDYINGVNRQITRRTNDIVLDPYTYLMYYKYGKKEVLKEELKHAIPAFLCRGLLITKVQEAVNGSPNDCRMPYVRR